MLRHVPKLRSIQTWKGWAPKRQIDSCECLLNKICDQWSLNVSIRFNLWTDCLALGPRFVTLASHTVAWRGGKPTNTTSMPCLYTFATCKTIRHFETRHGSAGKDLAENCGEPALVWVPLLLLASACWDAETYSHSHRTRFLSTPGSPSPHMSPSYLGPYSLHLPDDFRLWKKHATFRGTSQSLNTTWTSRRDQDEDLWLCSTWRLAPGVLVCFRALPDSRNSWDVFGKMTEATRFWQNSV